MERKSFRFHSEVLLVFSPSILEPIEVQHRLLKTLSNLGFTWSLLPVMTEEKTTMVT
jgi:hypothetical protein